MLCLLSIVFALCKPLESFLFGLGFSDYGLHPDVSISSELIKLICIFHCHCYSQSDLTLIYYLFHHITNWYFIAMNILTGFPSFFVYIFISSNFLLHNFNIQTRSSYDWTVMHGFPCIAPLGALLMFASSFLKPYESF